MIRIQAYRNQLAQGEKKILLIGSGLMAETLVDTLLKRSDNFITIASLLIDEANQLVKTRPRCKAVQLDVSKENDKLHQLVRQHDLTISYVPPQFIVTVAKVCLAESKHMVTAQYINPELTAMNQEAERKGIIMLNEIGLDPGIDHLATYKVKQDVQAKGGKIIEYESWCGGLPAPQFTNNPFGYKFSWSPLAAIRNVNNDARFIEDGKERYIPGSHLLYSSKPIKINPALTFEGYPNRNSIPYKDFYGLDDCTKVIRGTLRYNGFSVIMSGYRNLGLVQDSKLPPELTANTSFFSYLDHILDKSLAVPEKLCPRFLNRLAQTAHSSTHSSEQITKLLIKIFNKILAHDHYNNKSNKEKEEDAAIIFESMDWLRFFDESLKIKPGVSHLENFVSVLQERLSFLPGETDLIAMQHIFKIVYPGDPKIHTLKSTLVMTGEPNGRTAMALTVSIPVAIAVQLILDGEIQERGVRIPNKKEINEPIIRELEKYNLMCKEE